MDNKLVDLIIFAGQSNMAGRGDFHLAPPVVTERAFEYRAVSDPDRLHKIEEPFGQWENDPRGIYEPEMKTGSLVASFINTYTKTIDRTVIALSASRGGSSILEWQPGTGFFSDLLQRITATKQWLKTNGYEIKNVLFLWLQGETDGDNKMPAAQFKQLTTTFFNKLLANGVDQIFLLEIGNQRDEPERYAYIREAQRELGKLAKVIFIPTSFKKMAASGNMIDEYHYDQAAYNQCGAEIAEAVAAHLLTEQRPALN